MPKRSFNRLDTYDAGITHWQHPNFYAYFAANSNFESILADMYSTAVSNPGFNVSYDSYTRRRVTLTECLILVGLLSGMHRAGDGCHRLGC